MTTILPKRKEISAANIHVPSPRVSASQIPSYAWSKILEPLKPPSETQVGGPGTKALNPYSHRIACRWLNSIWKLENLSTLYTLGLVEATRTVRHIMTRFGLFNHKTNVSLTSAHSRLATEPLLRPGLLKRLGRISGDWERLSQHHLCIPALPRAD